jgi:hypothetical protein
MTAAAPTADLAPVTPAVEAWANDAMAALPGYLYNAARTDTARVNLLATVFAVKGGINVGGGYISDAGSYADHVVYVTSSKTGATVRFWVAVTRDGRLVVTGRDGIDGDF